MPTCLACGTDNPERAKFCLECGRRFDAPAASIESRRTVTVVFSDIVGSTALGERLDPEALRIVMSRYFEAMEAVLDRHGGTVEKFIGDAIMAVFGLRAIHEDDALRAVRAAAGMRERLAELNARLVEERGVTIATRTGVHTGEVAAGDGSARQMLVTGDAVNVAARLEQAATAGEILIGPTTWRLVRDSVTVEAIPPVPAKGKAEPIAAVRLLAVHAVESSIVGRRRLAPLVGRDPDLERLSASFADVVAGRTAAVVAVVGPAGVGKSRLVDDWLAGLDAGISVLRGRCLSYGDGITYWPLRDIVIAAAGIRADDTGDAASTRLGDWLRDLPEGADVAAKLAGAIGLADAPATRDEIFWAARRAFLHIAAESPAVVVVDDIQWAEDTFIELVDHLGRTEAVAGLLIVCLGRPELLERMPTWRERQPPDATLILEGIPPEAAGSLLESLPGGAALPAELRARILATADGNPLFVEEIVGMLAEGGAGTGTNAGSPSGGGDVAIPPTIQAVVAARIDALPPSERLAAQRASVIGREFESDAVVALTPTPAQPDVTTDLLGLLRRDLLEPGDTALSVADAYAFRHILIRDAAYDALPKSDRAELHERFADWLEATVGDRLPEFEEIVGYHLAQSYRLRSDLRELGARIEELGRRAAAHLYAAARRATERGDAAAAVRLLDAMALLPDLDPATRPAVDLEAAAAMFEVSRLSDARTRALAARAGAIRIEDSRVAARSRILLLAIDLVDGSLTLGDDGLAAALDDATREAERSNDDLAIAEAWDMTARVAWDRGDLTASEVAHRRALDHARAAGATRFALDTELNLLIAEFASPEPAPAVIEAAEALTARAQGYPGVRAEALLIDAVCQAMVGQVEAGLERALTSVALLRDLGRVSAVVNGTTYVAWIHRLAADPAMAEAVLHEALAEARDTGEEPLVAFVSCRLAEALVAQERYDEAADALVEAERRAISSTRTRIAGARARILAARGDPVSRELVEELFTMVDGSPWLNVRSEAYRDAAFALADIGDRDRALECARESLAMCRAKQNVTQAAQMERLVERLSA